MIEGIKVLNYWCPYIRVTYSKCVQGAQLPSVAGSGCALTYVYWLDNHTAVSFREYALQIPRMKSEGELILFKVCHSNSAWR